MAHVAKKGFDDLLKKCNEIFEKEKTNENYFEAFDTFLS